MYDTSLDSRLGGGAAKRTRKEREKEERLAREEEKRAENARGVCDDGRRPLRGFALSAHKKAKASRTRR